MALPFDPERVDPEDIGEHRLTLEMDHVAAIDRVRDVFEAEGFGVPVEFSVSELLNEKIDADRDPYYVLGACNPEMANRALDASDGDVGGLFPCNVIVRERDPGVQEVYHVSIMKIARLVGMAPDDEVFAEIVDETGEMVDAAYETLEE